MEPFTAPMTIQKLTRREEQGRLKREFGIDLNNLGMDEGANLSIQKCTFGGLIFEDGNDLVATCSSRK